MRILHDQEAIGLYLSLRIPPLAKPIRVVRAASKRLVKPDQRFNRAVREVRHCMFRDLLAVHEYNRLSFLANVTAGHA